MKSVNLWSRLKTKKLITSNKIRALIDHAAMHIATVSFLATSLFPSTDNLLIRVSSRSEDSSKVKRPSFWQTSSWTPKIRKPETKVGVNVFRRDKIEGWVQVFIRQTSSKLSNFKAEKLLSNIQT